MKIQDLRLALTATPPKFDVRYYLNGIMVNKNEVVASDGRRLCRIETLNNDIPEDLEQVIIPKDAVKNLLKRMGTKLETALVTIENNNGRLELTCLNHVEVFENIDAKYPDFSKMFDKIRVQQTFKYDTIVGQYNWDYLSIAHKAIEKYMHSTAPHPFYSLDSVGYFKPTDDITYIVMPIRV